MLSGHDGWLRLGEGLWAPTALWEGPRSIQWEGSGKQSLVRNHENIPCEAQCEQEEVFPAGSALANGEW